MALSIMLLVIKSFFIMSIFDPHGVYFHYQKKSHKGQVIQKKPAPNKSAVSKDDIPRAITTLKNFRYTIYPPGVTPPTPPVPTYYAFTGTSISYQSNLSSLTQQNWVVTFNNIWGAFRQNSEIQEVIQQQHQTGTSTVFIAISNLYLRFQGSNPAASTITTTSDSQTSISLSLNHVPTNFYVSITPNNATSYRYFTSSSQGGGAFTHNYSTPPETGYISSALISNSIPELSQGGLTDDFPLFSISTGSVSNYIMDMTYTAECSIFVQYQVN